MSVQAAASANVWPRISWAVGGNRRHTEKAAVTARVLIGGRRGVVIRSGGVGGRVAGMVLRRFLKRRAQRSVGY